jgi:serine/threonine protein kinase/tetratricopeptide (TPR) repeat protein
MWRPLADAVGGFASALADRYAVQRQIGAGGMATVYLAQDLKHRRQVAIKVLRPELSAGLGAERFVREIGIAAKLTHPHILPLFDSGEAEGSLYYVMPFVEGESLRERLVREGQLEVEEALGITRQVAAALDHAHRHGVVHRDVKPENILLHDGEALVADFGIALAVTAASDNRLTRDGCFVGTPEYMSPEQATGEDTLDARSDVYALACVLYEMLAGEPPYTGPSAHAIIAKRFADPIPGIRRVRNSVPVGVERALMKALACVPADRYPAAGAFSDALDAPVIPPPVEQSVAVLPFLNLSADPENEYFADGITEDVIAQLSKIRALKVISRTSVMRFKKREEGLREIGRALGVQALLEGSVRWAGDRVRIVAQLIDAETDRHLWADTYDRQLKDIFAIQSDVAVRIAEALETELSPEERDRIREKPTGNPEAYQLYLKGKRCHARMTNEGLRKALEYYREATEADPEYAMPHVGAGRAYIMLGMGFGPGAMMPHEAYSKAKAAVARALAIDDGVGDAHATLALIRFVADFDWAGAERAFHRALELNPGSAESYDGFGLMLAALERHDEAIAMRRRARELDPLAPIVASDLTTTLLRAGRYEEALREARRLLDIEPNIPLAHSTLGWAHIMRGEFEPGLAELNKASELAPGSTMFLAQLGEGFAMAGRREEARRILHRLEAMAHERYVPPYHLAYVYTGLGELDRAMDCLEQAYDERGGGIYGVKGSFLFQGLRSHPRFRALLAKMRLA